MHTNLFKQRSRDRRASFATGSLKPASSSLPIPTNTGTPMEQSQSVVSLLQDSQNQSDDALKLVIVCVGLPARGKSYITKKLQRYLNWMQYNTKIFNVGNTRRMVNVFTPSNYPVQGPTVDHNSPSPAVSSVNLQHPQQHDASLFDPANTQNLQIREQWARDTLDQMLNYLLSDDGNVGIFDATNTTKKRRKWVVETINKRTKGMVKILFLESICTDADLLEKNIRLKLSGPDYKKMDPQVALSDFRSRLRNYEKVYETIDEEEENENEQFDIQYVKIINAGKKVISYNISGYLSSQCVFFLLNFNLSDRQIWLTANGQSVFNCENRLGGDSDLTREGIAFAKALPKFITKKRQEFKLRQYNKEFIKDTTTFKTSSNGGSQNFNIWTSTLKRTIETAHYFPKDDFYFKSFKILNDLCCGIFDSITETEFRTLHADEYRESLENRLSYRYPGLGGESYLDVISRLRPIIIELERLKDHVLIVSHRVIIRVLLCYFMNLNKEMLTELEVQHNYVYCIEPKPYGLDLNIWHYDHVTDMFIEVDVAEIMKRKRKRGSLIINDVDRLRKLLLTQYNSSHDHQVLTTDDDTETGTETESESESGTESSLNDSNNNSRVQSIMQSPKVLVERSDSQAYEFSRNSSQDLKNLGLTRVHSNSKLNNSTSMTSIVSLSSMPSVTSMTSLSGLKQHLKGSSSDLRGQAIQQIHSAHSDTLTVPLSRVTSLKHLKKQSIDWDLYEPSTADPEELISDSANVSTKSESVSSGTNGNTKTALLNTEVELIMSNPDLVAKLRERLKE
ncbi:hypothetical protein CANINC_002864 [Pichia inconspicua]|uniref:6-phosphofructo-2-kinase domain-containing protein n=1 Tax=Pichia inconspicua TaxID=52247 RepID=A0A4T0X1V0_9ASCO|nr:hypothetical protein CANINC_002864 [[Candida] inconspicua]